jgi:hypothetical protein
MYQLWEMENEDPQSTNLLLFITIDGEKRFTLHFFKPEFTQSLLNRTEVKIWLCQDQRCVTDGNIEAFFPEDVIPNIFLCVPVEQVSLLRYKTVKIIG